MRLGYDPARKMALEEELSSSEHLLQEYERAQERCKARPKVEQERISLLSMQEHLAAETERLTTAAENLAYHPDLYVLAEAEWNRAEENHHRFMELRGKMEQLPELIESRSRTDAHIRGIRRDREETGRRIAALGFSRSRILEVETERKVADERVRVAEAELNRCSSTILLLQAEIARCAADLERAEQYRKQLDALREEREMLNLTQTMIGRYIVHLLTVVRGQIEGMVGDILGEITDGRYDRILLDEDFTILVNDMGGDYPADRFSGGEQDDIAIALRIALSRYLAGIHQIHDATFLIFDEIFGSQDEERRNNLIRALRTQEVHFPQILLISHIGEVQEEFQTTLSVELGPDQASRVEERCA
jgi:DNA repair protein SbcC/Rad50